MAKETRRPATFAGLAKLGDDVRAEIIRGDIVPKASPTYEHGESQRGLLTFLGRRFSRGSGGRWPGGWWIAVCHDAVGWRRDHVRERPTGRPLDLRPDWLGEILSPSNEKRDLVDKMRILRDAAVPHH